MIKYKEIKSILNIALDDECLIKGIVCDIQYVENNYIFIARNGSNYHALDDIDEAILKGAIVLHEIKGLKGFYIEQLFEKTKKILDIYYKDVCDNICIVGVSGTNGKSSVVSYLYQMIPDSIKIGSNFILSDKFKFINYNTTPDEITLLHVIELSKLNMIKYVFMEVTSQAIDLNRIDRILFDCIIYTSITRDHLDDHKTLLHYRYSKYKLVHYLKKDGFIISNVDELYFNELKKMCHVPLITYGFSAAHFQINDYIEGTQTTFYVNRIFFSTCIKSKMNVYNVCACIVWMRVMNYSYFEIYRKIKKLKMIEGRLELIYQKDFYIYVDYAHTSDAFYKSLQYFNTIKINKLIVVVGCGGEREKEKRKEIGHYASILSDQSIFCEDNSRNENVVEIINDMCLDVLDNVKIIKNRREAIEYAINIAEKSDIILISGKGNESFLLKNGEKIPFLDKEVVREILE